MIKKYTDLMNTFHVIKDPVHDTMQFTATENTWVKPFIDSPPFQRLRHIKQLGLGDFIFPGAVHTRFNHSLGCCYVASQVAQKIGLADEERQLVMIACLLHDMGHGPFSHAFECIFHPKLIRHEDWTPYFLEGYDTQAFFAEYNRLNPRYHLTKEKFQNIAAMIMHQPVAKPVLADIVSSQLDADRLDYLLRDSHFCGGAYGQFDFHWMLHCMTIVEAEGGERLGITHKGIGAVEHYLMARRLMTRNIYHSQKKLALEHLLVQLLASLAASLETEAVYQPMKHTRLGQFLMAANHFNQAFVKSLAEMEGAHPAIQIAKRLQQRQMPKIVRLDNADLESVEKILATFKRQHQAVFQDWQLTLIQTPHQAYSGEDGPILVVNEQGVISPITQFSVMIKAISDKLEHVVFLSIDPLIVATPEVCQLMEQLHAPSLMATI